MKFAKQTLTAAALLAVLALPARADLITFDPTGTAGATGNISGVALFDWAPGSALAVNVNSPTGISGAFTTYFQANLGTVQAPDTSALFTNGGGGNYFTAVAGFGETVATCNNVGGFCTNATFNFDASNPTNFFDIFAVGGTANNLTGAGFTGTSILSGVIVPTDFSSNFALSSTTPSPLDQSPLPSATWNGVNTVSGTGASSITVMVTFADSNYFPDLTAGSLITFSAFNTSQILPFKQVNPSHCMSDGSTDCAIPSLVGLFNGAPGSGPDVLFQADANQSFTVARVPEPGTLALIGLGVLVTGVLRKRQSRG